MKYAFIETQRNDHCVRTLCKALRVSASGYYAARNRPPSARTQRQSVLVLKIREAHVASRQSYGAPRVHAELAAQGVACCRNTVAKLMRQEQIVPRAIRKFRVTTNSGNTKAVSPNLLRRRFKVKRPNACWLSDITQPSTTRLRWLSRNQQSPDPTVHRLWVRSKVGLFSHLAPTHQTSAPFPIAALYTSICSAISSASSTSIPR